MGTMGPKRMHGGRAAAGGNTGTYIGTTLWVQTIIANIYKESNEITSPQTFSDFALNGL